MLTLDKSHVYITACEQGTKFPVGRWAATDKSRDGRHSDEFGIVWRFCIRNPVLKAPRKHPTLLTAEITAAGSARAAKEAELSRLSRLSRALLAYPDSVMERVEIDAVPHAPQSSQTDLACTRSKSFGGPTGWRRKPMSR